MYSILHIKQDPLVHTVRKEISNIDECVDFLYKFFWIREKRSRKELRKLLKYMNSKLTFENTNEQYSLIIKKT